MSCAKCKYFQENRCFRYPPTPTQYGEAVYPRVGIDSPQCGEFAEIVPTLIGNPYETEIKTTKTTKRKAKQEGK